MSIPVIDTIEPLGDFPVAKATAIDAGNGKRLNIVLAEKANESNVANELNNKVDKVTGKGLSTNDYTDDEKTKLANAASNISALQNGKVDKVTGKGLSTNDYTDSDKTKLSNAVDSINSLQSSKVDKISGKGLSTNDYSDTEKTKVNNATEELTKLNGYFTLV